MSSAFSFSGNPDEGMPLNAVNSAQVLAEIEMTMRSDEIGEGKAFDNGALFIRYNNFCIRVEPDGTFMGQRTIPDPIEIPQQQA